MAFKITDDNFALYKEVADTIWRFMFPQSSSFLQDGHPGKLLEQMTIASKARARRGLKIALLEIASTVKDMPPSMYKLINDELLARHLPDLATLQRNSSDIVGKIIRRGTIRNEDEYRVINEVLSDADNAHSEEDRKRLGEYMAIFEKNIRAEK